MARTDSKWQTGGNGTYIQTIAPAGYDILINGTSKYLNFNTTVGSLGYGFRDNAGTMEFKDSGGNWTSFAGSTAGVSSVNGLTGAVILAAGSNISLTPVGNTITIASTGGGGGSPGGSNTQLQYNNSSSFGGISGATTNGSAVTFGAASLIQAGAGAGVSTFAYGNTATNSTTTIPTGTTTLAGLALAQTFTGINTFSPTARTSGVASYLTINAAADTGITATTESIGLNVVGATRTWVDGTTTTQREYFFGKPTYNKTTTSATFTNAYTVYIEGAPVAGTGVTITNAWALGIGGNTYINGRYTLLGTATPNNTGLSAGSSTGAELWGTDNTTLGVQMGVGNTSNGTSGYSFYFLNNDLAVSNDATHYAGMGYTSSTYTDSTFGTGVAVANQYQFWNTDGAITTIATKVGALGKINWLLGGSATANEVLSYTQTNGLTISPLVQASGTPTLLTLTAPAHTGLTTTVEVPGINLNLSATRTWAAGTITTQREVRIQAPTYAFASASTITNASTLDIGGFPIAGTNATITSASALSFSVAPKASATSAMVNFSNTALSSGSANGTYLGMNPAAFTGDFIRFQINGTSNLIVTGAGTLTAQALVSNNNVTAAAGGRFVLSGRSFMQSSADGLIELENNAGTGFTRLNLGGTTSSFPSIKRNGTALNFRLADDSGDAAVTASTGTFANLVTNVGGILVTSGSGISWNSRSQLSSANDGNILMNNNAANGFTNLIWGPSTSNSFNAISRDAVNGFTIQSAASTATFNDNSTANSGTVANRYLFGIAAPTLSSTGTSVTYTVASSIYIGGAPAAGTNVTIGTAYSLNVAAGNSNFGGNITSSGTYNKVTITAPATGSTLTIADGKTITANVSPTFSGANMTFTGSGAITTTFPTEATTLLGTVGNDRKTAQTAAVNLATYTVGASDATFIVSANVLVTTSTVHAFTVTCSYTDEGNTARVLTLQFSSLAGAMVTSIANAAGAVPYEGAPLQIRCKAATTIIIGSAGGGTYTTVTYNIEERIIKVE